MSVLRLHFASWIPKGTYTHSEYVILVAFLLQQCLNVSATLLRYPYFACIVNLFFCRSEGQEYLYIY
jgi:hypothetical protein